MFYNFLVPAQKRTGVGFIPIISMLKKCHFRVYLPLRNIAIPYHSPRPSMQFYGRIFVQNSRFQTKFCRS